MLSWRSCRRSISAGPGQDRLYDLRGVCGPDWTARPPSRSRISFGNDTTLEKIFGENVFLGRQSVGGELLPAFPRGGLGEGARLASGSRNTFSPNIFSRVVSLPKEFWISMVVSRSMVRSAYTSEIITSRS